MTVVALDFETANRSASSPCAIGLAFVEEGRVTHRAYSLVRPRDMTFDPTNVRVHGIRPSDVVDAPEFPEVWDEFGETLGGALVLAHNASFDMRVLGATLSLYGLPQPAFRCLCTVSLARRLWPHEPSRRLSALAAKFGIGFTHHHAGEDAYACAAIALEGVRQAGARDVPHLASTLGLVRAVASMPARRTDGLAARALAARGADATRLDNFVRFRVRGSKGTPYDIVLKTDGRGARTLFCSCPGARFRPECRHAKALLGGDHSALVAGNAEEFAQLSALLSASLRIGRAA